MCCLAMCETFFFQGNPFKDLGKGLFVGMENPDYTIGTEQYNQKWIIDAYGDSFYSSAKDEQVSCSGVTIGDMNSIKVYINKMIEEFCKQPYQKCLKEFMIRQCTINY